MWVSRGGSAARRRTWSARWPPTSRSARSWTRRTGSSPPSCPPRSFRPDGGRRPRTASRLAPRLADLRTRRGLRRRPHALRAGHRRLRHRGAVRPGPGGRREGAVAPRLARHPRLHHRRGQRAWRRERRRRLDRRHLGLARHPRRRRHLPTSRRSPFAGGQQLPEQYKHTLDPFVALTAAAAATKKLRVGTGICLIIERDTITTAKSVASLDLLSHGRFEFGLGGGWNAEEVEPHGTAVRARS